MASTRLSGTLAKLRGWLLHDGRFNASTFYAGDGLTQAVPRAGGPGVPGSTPASAAAVEVSGDQDQSFVVKCLQGGFPGLGRGGMRVGYRGAADGAFRGWQPPNVITHCSSPDWSSDANDSLTGVTLRTGEILAAWRDPGGLMEMATWDPDTASWTSGLTPPVATDVDAGIGLAIDEDGRILVLFKHDVTGAAFWSLYRSDARDDTEGGWTEVGRHPFAFGYSPSGGMDRFKLLVLPSGDIALVGIVADGATGTIVQWASSDGGSTFEVVDNTANVTANVSDAFVTPAGRVALLQVDASNVLKIRTVTTPWSSVMDSSSVTIASSVAEAWGCADPSGRIWAWSRGSGADVDKVSVHYSDDEGETWVTMDQGLLSFAGDTGQYLTGGVALQSGGAFFLLSQAVDGAGTGDASPLLTRCGGWSSMVLQGDQAFEEADLLGSGDGAGTASWAGCCWIPVAEPGALSCWTTLGTGSSADDGITADGRLDLSPASPTTRYWEASTAPGTSADVVIVEADVACTTTGSTGSEQCEISVQLSDGFTATQLNVWVGTTGFGVAHHGSVLATITVDMTDPMVIRMVMKRGAFLEVWYRRPYETTWTRAYTSTSVTTTASASTWVRWGARLNTSSTVSSWGHVWFRAGNIVGDGIGLIGADQSQLDNMDWVFGRQLTGLPTPLALRAAATAGEGTRTTLLRGRDGPARTGDTWTVAPAYDYPALAVLPQVEPSPQRRWRSTGTGADSPMVFILDGGNDTSLGRSIGLGVLRANVRYVKLEGWDGAAWSTRATLDLATGFTSLSYTRTGNVLRIASTADATRYVWRHELVGATVSLGSSKYRKILRHTEGLWSDVAGKHVEIVLEGVDGTEPSSGTMDIWAHSGVVVVHGESALYDEWRVLVPSGSNADGYQEIGSVVAGQVVAAGLPHAWGGSATFEPNAEREGVGNRERVRHRGDPVRTWTWAWPDGVDLSRLRDASPTPDYLAHTATTEGIANSQDVPFLLSGLLEEQRSGELPVIALAAIPETSGTTITDPSLFLYGTFASSIGVEHVQGEEGQSEVVRVAPVTVRGTP